MLDHNRRFKLILQIEYTFFTSKVPFCDCFMARTQLAEDFPLEIYNSRKSYAFKSLNIRNILY